MAAQDVIRREGARLVAGMLSLPLSCVYQSQGLVARLSCSR